jgi:transposase InsO family protein
MPVSRREANALQSSFYDTKQPSAFTGVVPVTRAARRSEKTITFAKAREWLSGEPTYVLHRPARKRFLRSKIFAPSQHALWEADLTFFDKLKRFNENVKYLLVVIDVFSKVAAVQPLRTKSTKDVTRAFERILHRLKVVPVKLRTDRGTEFNSALFRRLMAKHGIHHYMTFDADIKAGVAERFNRTIKGRIARYMTANQTRRYLPQLQNIVSGYNNSHHRSIGMTPNSVNKGNARTVWERLYGDGKRRTRLVRPKFRVNDRVLITKSRDIFDRGYTHNWQKEVFVVHHVTLHHPFRYHLKDSDGEVLRGTFYEQEMQHISPKIKFAL